MNDTETDPLEIQNLNLDLYPFPSGQRLNPKPVDPSENFSEITEKKTKKTLKPSPPRQKKTKSQVSKAKGGDIKSKKTTYSSIKKKTEKRVFTYVVSEQIVALQKEATEVYEKYVIKAINLENEDYSDMQPGPVKKASIFKRVFCCSGDPILKPWMIESDCYTITGETYENVKNKAMNEIGIFFTNFYNRKEGGER